MHPQRRVTRKARGVTTNGPKVQQLAHPQRNRLGVQRMQPIALMTLVSISVHATLIDAFATNHGSQSSRLRSEVAS